MPARIRPPHTRTLALAATASAGPAAGRGGSAPLDGQLDGLLDGRRPAGGKRSSSSTARRGTPPHKHGRRLVLAGWDIADTGNAFYQCSDAEFG
ncbi:lytic polysaccharide monooxygenase [Actinomadura decatromicini]|uniref:Lytic polysaccharide monooxygenase n=1 Tax=Actinomadura decatromicini TaxID=2604572 RepID=A0A5D3FEK7_9ACTN|nr:lytic polysaccharide monooxygenase [Actinomadura decatromicini]TYK46306.1 lytic polysaccharide monooxygenase [Actinomadura decatromicini]